MPEGRQPSTNLRFNYCQLIHTQLFIFLLLNILEISDNQVIIVVAYW